MKEEMKKENRFYCPDCLIEYAIAFGYKKLGAPIHCDNCGGDNVIDRELTPTPQPTKLKDN